MLKPLLKKLTIKILIIIMKQEKDSTLPPIKSISHLPYITFFENYWEIYRYNKPTLKSFHKCFFHTFNNILPNPLDIYKPEIYKKISSHFKITPLLEYLSLESYDPALFEKKLEKSDYSILFRLLKDLLMILERNTKKLKEEVPLNENKWNTLELISHNPFPAQSELTQTDELAMGQKENNSFNGENFNVMVLEIVEFAETTCFIVPNFSGISTFSFMEQSLNSIMQSFIENREERLDFGSFLEKVVPIDIKQLIIKLEDEEGEGVMLEEEGIVKTLLECFFTEKNFQMKRIEVLVDKMFLFEFSALSQLCKVANLGLALGKNFFILPENKHNFYEEMINNKKNIISTMTPSVSKEPYKKLFMKMNYNYLLAFEWISQKKFKFQLIFKEIGKEFWGNWINLDSLEEYKSPLKLFHMFLIKLQV